MRISDWSSDVCSSDLPTAADCPSGTTDVGEIAGLVNCQLPSRIIGDFTLPKVDGVVFSLNGRTDVGEDMGGDARSEEHTSELQSLMRISYAVFCLKKNSKET